MKNYVQDDGIITVPAPYTVLSGGGCLFGHLFGVAQAAAAQGANVALVTEGVYDLPKHAGDTPAGCDLVYWDDTAHVVTTTAAANHLIGCTTHAALGADATVRVRLN